jgi:hypothetical protein
VKNNPIHERIGRQTLLRLAGAFGILGSVLGHDFGFNYFLLGSTLTNSAGFANATSYDRCGGWSQCPHPETANIQKTHLRVISAR